MLSMMFYTIIETIIEFPVTTALLVALPVLSIAWVLFNADKDWQSAKKPAYLMALATGLIAFFFLPMLFSSSLFELRYIVDWLFHLAFVMGLMLYAFFVAWFALAPRRV